MYAECYIIIALVRTRLGKLEPSIIRVILTTNMVQEYAGKYKLIKNEKFAEYLEANGKLVIAKPSKYFTM